MFHDIPQPGLAQRVVVRDCDVGSDSRFGDFVVLEDCSLGRGCRVGQFVFATGCDVGDDCALGSFVELRRGATLGDGCRIHSGTVVGAGATLGDDVVLEEGVTLVADRGRTDARPAPAVRDGAVVGANATVLSVEIGRDATVRPGAVVTDDVPPNAVVEGNPAEVVAPPEET